MRSIPPLRTRPSADDVTAGVDIFDIPGQRGRAIADQKCREISNILNARQTVLGRTGTSALQ
jgi:hypothetical protein